MRDMAEMFRTIAYAPSKDADIKRENANIDGESSMGAMLKYGSEGAKAFNLDEVIPDEFSKAPMELSPSMLAFSLFMSASLDGA